MVSWRYYVSAFILFHAFDQLYSLPHFSFFLFLNNYKKTIDIHPWSVFFLHLSSISLIKFIKHVFPEGYTHLRVLDKYYKIDVQKNGTHFKI